jgi:hypothetical protein
MSNPTTNYKISTGQDLGAIFQPLTSATKAPTTGFTVNGTDLNQIFAKYIPGSTQSPTTGFTVNGTDLNSIFSPIQNTFTTTSQLITTSFENNMYGTLAINFKLQPPYTKLNFVLYGGGGNGSQPGSGNNATGGAGSGAFIKALNIPYYYPGSTTEYISTITYGISGGGNNSISTVVSVQYTNGTIISLSAGSGASKTSNSGGTGAAGGSGAMSIAGVAITTVENTTITNTLGTFVFFNGEPGGNTSTRGTSNGYTSSGSGSSTSGAYAPYGNPPTVTNTFTGPNSTAYPIISYGGGNSQTVAGYGAGGAATPANWNSAANSYRLGTPGCLIYYLS